MRDLDLHDLDGVDPGSEEASDKLGRYREDLVGEFAASPEAAELGEASAEAGGWTGLFIDLGFNHLGATPPSMGVTEVEELVTELFPRKVSLTSPEEADEVIRELSAFWRYLGREYRLANAPAIVEFLRGVEPEYRAVMNDPSKFGMARSVFMAGQAAGFDMSNEEEMQRFIAQYNAATAGEREASGRGRSRASHPGELRRQRKQIGRLSGRGRKKKGRRGGRGGA